MSFGIYYSVQTGETEHNQLTIRPNGVVTAWITYSIPGTAIRSLGHFYMATEAGDLDLLEIERLCRNEGLLDGTPYTSESRYGERLTFFEIEAEGKTIQHYIDTLDPFPDSLAMVEERLQPVFRRVARDGAQRAVSFRLGFEQAKISPGADTTAFLEITNAGSFPAEIRNFAGFQRGGPDVLKIDFWVPSKSPGGSPVFLSDFDLSGREWLIADRKSLRSTNPYLRLAAGQILKTWTEFRMPKSEPGLNFAELIYYAHSESDEEGENNDFIVGEFHADPVKITVS